MVAIETAGLSKDFRGFRAANGVYLRVLQGTVHALVGPNGAGKTTLFNLLTGFLRPSQGRIFLFGEEITGLPPRAALVLLLRDWLSVWTDAWGVVTGVIFVAVVLGFRRGLFGALVAVCQTKRRPII